MASTTSVRHTKKGYLVRNLTLILLEIQTYIKLEIAIGVIKTAYWNVIISVQFRMSTQWRNFKHKIW